MEKLKKMRNFKGTNETKPTSHHSGITLIALVVTIVILLILAAITINLVLAEGGLFERAQNTEEEHEKSAAREELELKLADIQIEKVTNSKYNNEEQYYAYLREELINQEGFILIVDDIVEVDGWQFQIDRSVPKIIDDSLGKGSRNTEIKLEITQPNEATDFVKATISIKITSAEEISNITINGQEIDITAFTEETIDGNKVYTGEKIVTDNIIYSIIAKNINNEYNNGTIKISSITENMDIYDADDLLAFRKKVNEEGRTFEGRTVRVMNNIDMSTICGEEIGNWEPIGATGTYFAGTFNGNYHTISNLYFSATNSYTNVGLFSEINSSNTVLENIILNNVYMYHYGSKSLNIGALAGNFSNGTMQNCAVLSGDIIVSVTTSSALRRGRGGGLIGYSSYRKDRWMF